MRCAVRSTSTVNGPGPVTQTVTFADADGGFLPSLIITQGGYCAINAFATEAGSNPAFWLYDIGLGNAGQTWSAAAGSGGIWPFHTFKAGSGAEGTFPFMDTLPGLFFGGAISALGYISAVANGSFDITWSQKDLNGASRLIVVLGGDDLVIDYGFAGGLGTETKATITAMVALLTMTTQATYPRGGAYGAATGAGSKAMGWGFDTKTSGRAAASAQSAAFGSNYAGLLSSSCVASFNPSGAGAWVVNNATITDWGPTSYTITNGGAVHWGGLGFGGTGIKSAAGTFIQKSDGIGTQRIQTGVKAKWVKLLSIGKPSTTAVTVGAAQLVVGWADANGGQVGWWVNETGSDPGPLVGARYASNLTVLRFGDTPAKDLTVFTAIAEMVEVAADGSFTINWTTNDNVPREIAWFVLGEAPEAETPEEPPTGYHACPPGLFGVGGTSSGTGGCPAPVFAGDS